MTEFRGPSIDSPRASVQGQKLRVLYVADYQGTELVQSRGICRNRALGGSRKIEAIAIALTNRGHEVTVLSAGVVAERTFRVFGSLRETFGGTSAAVRVEYLPAIDVPGLNRLAATLQSSRWLRGRGGWDIAIVYNLGSRQVRAAEWLRQKGIPVVFEYEDDASATVQGGSGANRRGISWLGRARRAGNGVIAVHEALRLQIGLDNADVIEGVVGNELFEFPARRFQPRLPLRVLYAGGLSSQKGVDLMLQAVETINFPLEVTITGSGPLANEVSEAASHDHRIRFLGEVSRSVLHDELGRCHVGLNPHRVPDGHTAIVFPFKIAEYAASGAVVVSSAMQEIPAQLRESMVTYESDTPLAIACALSDAATHYDELCVRAQGGRDYVRSHLSLSAVGGRVEAILDEAIRASHASSDYSRERIANRWLDTTTSPVASALPSGGRQSVRGS